MTKCYEIHSKWYFYILHILYFIRYTLDILQTEYAAQTYSNTQFIPGLCFRKKNKRMELSCIKLNAISFINIVTFLHGSFSHPDEHLFETFKFICWKIALENALCKRLINEAGPSYLNITRWHRSVRRADS